MDTKFQFFSAAATRVTAKSLEWLFVCPESDWKASVPDAAIRSRDTYLCTTRDNEGRKTHFGSFSIETSSAFGAADE
jgi:hypothetical protein